MHINDHRMTHMNKIDRLTTNTTTVVRIVQLYFTVQQFTQPTINYHYLR
jgi:hypothetical protein